MARSHRPVAPFAAALLAATAVVLALGAAVTAAPTATLDPGPATAALVRGYYEAVNAALATGDAAGLDAVVAPGALIGASGGDAETPADLAHRLAAVHRARPGLRVIVERVVADRDGAVAAIALAGDARGGPVIVPVAGAAGLLDGFRIRDGRIAEIWGATPDLDAPAPLIRAEPKLPPVPGPVLVGLARLELDPGTETPALSGPGPIAVAVESGTLSMRKVGAALVTRDVPGGGGAVERIAGAVATALEPGDQLVLETGGPFRLRNEGEEPAVVLIAVLFPVASTAFPPPYDPGRVETRSSLVRLVAPLEGDSAEAWPDGMVARRLSGESLADVPVSSLRLEVDRAALPPGIGLATSGPAAQSVLVIERGLALVRSERSNSAAPRVIGADDGATETVLATSTEICGVGNEAASLLLVSLSSAPNLTAPR